jgi:hypothetical protein
VTSETDFRITAPEVLGYIGCETGIRGGLLGASTVSPYAWCRGWRA